MRIGPLLRGIVPGRRGVNLLLPFGPGGSISTTDALEDLLADAIVAELNDPARSWAALFAAESCIAKRTRAPWYSPTDPSTNKSPLKTLKIAVVPMTLARSRAAKQRRQLDYGIGIDLQRLIEPLDDVTLKKFSKLAQDIHDFFDDGHPLTTQPLWICLQTDRPDIYALSDLYGEAIWETFLSATVRGFKK